VTRREKARALLEEARLLALAGMPQAVEEILTEAGFDGWPRELAAQEFPGGPQALWPMARQRVLGRFA
jgi:hypothetical protein